MPKKIHFRNTGNFYKDLAIRESSDNHEKENELYYLGLYQMGEAALVDAGYYKKNS